MSVIVKSFQYLDQLKDPIDFFCYSRALYTLFINFRTNNLIKTREPRKLIVSGMLSSSLSTSCLISITFEMVDLSIPDPLIGNNQNHNSYSVVQKISKPFISMDMVSSFRHTLTLPHLSHSSDIVAVQMINICFPPLKIENPPCIHKSKSSGFKIQENSIYAFLLFATCQRKIFAIVLSARTKLS